MPAGCLVVVDAMGVTDAGIFGDILCARMKKRGVAGLITDGTVRDVAGVLGTGLPVWSSGVAAPPHAYFQNPASDTIAIGGGLYAPYGLSKKWPRDFGGPFVTYDTSQKTF